MSNPSGDDILRAMQQHIDRGREHQHTPHTTILPSWLYDAMEGSGNPEFARMVADGRVVRNDYQPPSRWRRVWWAIQDRYHRIRYWHQQEG